MILTRRRFLAASGATLVAHRLSADEMDILQIEGPAFGAGWSIRVSAEADTAAVVRAITDVVQSVDAAMSPFRGGSELSRFNRADTTDWVPVSPAMITTVAKAAQIAEQTLGAFDPTLGGVAGRYGFGPITTPPEGAFGEMAIAAGGLAKAHPRQTLDLCGIAKGHALDQCVAALRAIGLTAFFIELGGEVFALGTRPDGQPWRAGVERPLPGGTPLQCIVTLSSEALATSGDRINSYSLSGHRYGHIIDPVSLRPAENEIASVSVFAPQAIAADALATALFAMGPERGAALAEQAGFAALFLIRDGVRLREVMTGGFSNRIVQG
jgi:FAD:protein FMN transferase